MRGMKDTERGEMMKERYEECKDKRKRDCFACVNGVCLILNNTTFKRPCPFFKTDQEAEASSAKAMQRAKKLGYRYA